MFCFFTIVHITIWSELRQLTDEDPDLVIICHVMNSKHFNSVVSSVNPIFSTDPYFNTVKCLTFYIAFFIQFFSQMLQNKNYCKVYFQE